MAVMAAHVERSAMLKFSITSVPCGSRLVTLYGAARFSIGDSRSAAPTPPSFGFTFGTNGANTKIFHPCVRAVRAAFISTER
jgi:hypothetical protein